MIFSLKHQLCGLLATLWFLFGQVTSILKPESAKKHEFPYVGILKNGKADGNLCGITLVATQWILTSAHCMEPIYGFNVSDFQIVLGEHDRTILEDDELVAEVEKVVMHPKYDKKTHANDIALVKLKTPVDLLKYKKISVACLAVKNISLSGLDCVVPGWGMDGTKTDTELPSKLKKTNVIELKHGQCVKSLKSKITENITNDHVCTVAESQPDGEEEAGGVCGGDSGGPLLCRLHGKLHQVAIVWLTSDCGKQATVHLRISSYASWINEIANHQTPAWCESNEDHILPKAMALSESFKESLKKVGVKAKEVFKKVKGFFKEKFSMSGGKQEDEETDEGSAEEAPKKKAARSKLFKKKPKSRNKNKGDSNGEDSIKTKGSSKKGVKDKDEDYLA